MAHREMFAVGDEGMSMIDHFQVTLVCSIDSMTRATHQKRGNQTSIPQFNYLSCTQTYRIEINFILFQSFRTKPEIIDNEEIKIKFKIKAKIF